MVLVVDEVVDLVLVVVVVAVFTVLLFLIAVGASWARLAFWRAEPSRGSARLELRNLARPPSSRARISGSRSQLASSAREPGL